VLAGLFVDSGAAGTAVWMAAKAWVLVVPAAWVLWVDRKPLRCSRPSVRGLVAGALLGLVVAALIVGTFLWLGPRWVDPSGLRAAVEPHGLTSRWVYLAGAAYWILGNSLLEEYVYRWFVFSKARTLWGARWAVVVAALAFVIHHALALAVYFDWRVTALACTGVFIGSVLWSMLYRRYGNIWAPYVSHAIIDVAVFALGWVLLFG